MSNLSQDEIWAQLCDRHPDFKDDGFILQMRARGLRRLIEQAWEEGRKKGVEDGKSIERYDQSRKKKRAGGMDDLARELFGGLGRK